MSVMTKAESQTVILQRGVVIWRSAIHSRGGARPVQFEELKKEDGKYVMRMSLAGCNMIYEPECYPISVDLHGQRVRTKGLVLMVEGDLDPNFTHVTITGVSKALHQPYERLAPSGGVVFARAERPYKMADYLKFRTLMGETVMRSMILNFEDKYKLVQNIWPDEERPGLLRLVTDWNQQQGTDRLCEYEFLEEMGAGVPA